jgi:hypothetical protein
VLRRNETLVCGQTARREEFRVERKKRQAASDYDPQNRQDPGQARSMPAGKASRHRQIDTATREPRPARPSWEAERLVADREGFALFVQEEHLVTTVLRRIAFGG